MTLYQKSMIALIVVALALAAWMGRWQIATGGPDNRLVVHLDRWTGLVYFGTLDPAMRR